MRSKLVILLVFFCLLFPSTTVYAEGEQKSWWQSFTEFFTGSKTEEEKKQQETSSTGSGNLLIDNLIPEKDRPKKVGQVQLDYNAYPLSHYQLDLYIQDSYFWQLTDSAANVGAYFFHGLNNMLWSAVCLFSRFVIYILENALTLDLVNEIGKDIGKTVQELAGFNGGLQKYGLWGLLLPIVILGAGCWVGWKAIAQGQVESAYRGFLASVVIILFSFFFFYSSYAMMKQLNDLTSNLRNSVLGLAAINDEEQEEYTTEEMTAAATNQVWTILVMKPYLLLQYGTTNVDKSRYYELLKYSQSDVKRASAVETEVSEKNNISMTSKSLFLRFMFILFVLLLNVAIGAVMLLVSAGILFFQLVFLFMWMWAPIALIWAVVPTMREGAKRWAAEVLGAQVMSFNLGVLLTIYFVFSDLLYDWSAEKGYLKMMLGQLILVAVFLLKRKEIFAMINEPLLKMVGAVGKAPLFEGMIEGVDRRMRRPYRHRYTHHSSSPSLLDQQSATVMTIPKMKKRNQQQSNEMKTTSQTERGKSLPSLFSFGNQKDDEGDAPASGATILGNQQDPEQVKNNLSDDDSSPPPDETQGGAIVPTTSRSLVQLGDHDSDDNPPDGKQGLDIQSDLSHTDNESSSTKSPPTNHGGRHTLIEPLSEKERNESILPKKEDKP